MGNTKIPAVDLTPPGTDALKGGVFFFQ